MSPHNHHTEEDERVPDTETVEKVLRRQRGKALATVAILIGVIGGMAACWAFVGSAVDLTRTPEKVRNLETNLLAEASTRQLHESDVREQLAAIRANNADIKESLAEIKQALRIVPQPKHKEDPIQ